MNTTSPSGAPRKHVPSLILALVFAGLPFALPYPALATSVMLFALAAVAFDLCLGFTGLMMFCQASFFGTGIYVTALTLIHLKLNIFAAIACGVLGASLLAAVFGYMATFRSGSYSVLLTMASNELVYFIVFQWSSLTGGDDGLSGIPRPPLSIPGLFSVSLESTLAYYYFAYVFFIGSFLLIRCIAHSPFGTVLKSIRENEQRARAIGYNVRLYKVMVFVIGGAFMGLSGSLYSMFLNFAHPQSVHFEVSGNIVMMTLIGGMGTLFGPVVGAFIMVVASDILSSLWDRWLLVMGVAFVCVVLFAPGGVWGVFTRMARSRTAGKHPQTSPVPPGEPQ